jgi:toxin ParE1/3/4
LPTCARTMQRGLHVKHRIVWLATAQSDLKRLYNWIADQADADTALEYTAHIQAYTSKLKDWPLIGSPHDELAAGIRTITYRRRTIIAYQVIAGDVEVMRIFHGGQELRLVFDE